MRLLVFYICVIYLCLFYNYFITYSSRIGETDELPEIRVDAASPGPRVTFNIQDTVRETVPVRNLCCLVV